MKPLVTWTILGLGIVLFGIGTVALIGVGLALPDDPEGVAKPVSILALVGALFSVVITVRLLAVAFSRIWRSLKGRPQP
jgi:hypothetical protein